jgi:putative chitinase
MITSDILHALCPKTRDEILHGYVDPLNEIAAYYELTTPARLAGFLAQIIHESGSFNFTKENLNYSAKGLRGVFSKYFPDDATAEAYARQPEKIANKVYANRMGNGDEASGDGFKFCGRGLIQLTGRTNYTKFAEAVSMSLDDAIAYLETPEGAVASAGWFWDNNGLNDYCDNDDFTGLTKRINGGTNGLAERLALYNAALPLVQE